MNIFRVRRIGKMATKAASGNILGAFSYGIIGKIIRMFRIII